MEASISPASNNRLIWRMTILEWYDDEEEDRDGDDGGDDESSSIKFSDLAKSMIRASSGSQFTGAVSMAVCLVPSLTPKYNGG